MKLSLFGRLTMALLASVALGLGMTACGGGTIGYLWVLGQQYNQIAGFKIDDYTGNLTTVPTSPFSTGGSVPVSLVVKPGGRYVYVINQGATTGTNPGGPTQAGAGQSIVEFAVGGDGTLTYQATYQTQGYVSQWAQMDATGTYLYVLDKYAPGLPNNGAITVFASDSNTGRLSLIQNTQTLTPQGLATNFWTVGQSPIMMKTAGSCLFTLNSSQTVSPFSIGAGGQLTTVTQGVQLLSTNTATSITGNSSYIYVTDSAGGTSTNNFIFPFTIGTGCALTSVTGGAVNQGSFALGVVDPVYTMVDNSGKYLYVLNYSNTNTTSPKPVSNISAYTISPVNGELQIITGSPFTVGSGPVCMVEDTSNQYVYISNHNDGTVTGKVIDPTTGNLSNLTRGATFTASGQASCLVLSGAVS